MQHECYRCPVTALTFLTEDVILAGEGHYLKAYDVASRHALQTVKIFDNQAVHGITLAVDLGYALVWGGRYIRTLSVSGESGGTAIRLGKLFTLDDWIIDVAFRPHLKDASIDAGLITAHNALWSIRLDAVIQQDEAPARSGTLERLVPGSNCILYSAHIKWLSASQCLLASGTAFGDVVLWSAHLDENVATRTQTHFTFSAHEGSVFGVQISSLLRLPGHIEDQRVLASCSDDRTIRLWDITDLSPANASLTDVQRDTGFGSAPHDEAHAPPLLARVMGHTSRIWHVRFCDHVGPTSRSAAELLSCGEDAAAHSWRLVRSSSSLPYDLQVVNTTTSHSGKNIWSIAQHASGSVATGGADGALALYRDLRSSGINAETPRSLLQSLVADAKDNYKAYAFVSDNTLIATTEQGRVVGIDLTGDCPIKELSGPVAALRGYSVVASCNGVAFISGTDGTIWCHVHPPNTLADQPGQLKRMTQWDGKTGNLFAAQDDTGRLRLLATGIGRALPTLYTLANPGMPQQPPHSSDVITTPLHLPVNTVVTTFALCKVEGTNLAVLGTRAGAVLVCDLGQDPLDPGEVVQLTHGRNALHDKEAVTAIICEVRDGYGTFILSAGRDGTIAVQRLWLRSPDGRPHLTLVHQLTLPLGPNIEGLYATPESANLSVWGFRGKHFVQYNATTQQEIMSVECGGAHRNWIFRPTSDGQGGTFVWTKASKVYSHTQTEQPCALINSGGHGREIKSIAISSEPGDGHGMRRQIMATGAEDTDIKLHHFDANGWRCLQTLRKHNTGIQHLAWLDDHLFSSGGFEEFFVWRVSHHVPCFDVGVVCESMHPRSGKSDLRICGFHVERACLDGQAAQLEITMAYSDSTLKLWRYGDNGATDESVSWALRATVDYLTACLTHVFRPAHSAGALVTAATDGHLAFWRSGSESDGGEDAPAVLPWHRRQKVHQSAIHALTSGTLADGSTLVVTGGDDNAIALTRIGTTGGYTAVEHAVATLLVPRAHAAAVTGLALLPPSLTATSPHRSSRSTEGVQRETYQLVSAGIDQRVKLWRVSIDTVQNGIDGVDMERLQSVYTAVADASGLEVCALPDGERGVVVSGIGVDVWRLPQEEQRLEQ